MALHLGREPDRRTTGDVVDHPEYADHRRRQDRGVAGLVVERHVAAGDRHPQLAGSRRPARGSPRRTATSRPGPPASRSSGSRSPPAAGRRWWRRCGRPRPARACAPMYGSSFAKRPLQSVATATPRPLVLVDPDHPAVLGLGEHRVAQHVAVVLVRHPRLVAQVRRRDQRQQRLPQLLSGAWPRQLLGPSACSSSCQAGRAKGARRPGPRARRSAAVRRRSSPCQSISSRPVSVTSPMTSACTSHFAQISRKRLDVRRLDDRHHPLLRLAHQDLLRSEGGVAQRHLVERDVHATVARAGQLRRRARQPGATEVLDAVDEVLRRTARACTRSAASP